MGEINRDLITPEQYMQLETQYLRLKERYDEVLDQLNQQAISIQHLQIEMNRIKTRDLLAKVDGSEVTVDHCVFQELLTKASLYDKATEEFSSLSNKTRR